jgi:DNA-binding HxlR family transcriptional regulator
MDRMDEAPEPAIEAPKGYGQYCPITRAVEVLGERWSLLIVRDMITGSTHFNDLARGNPGLSRSLLSKRLRQLERAGIVERVDDQYRLTPAGRDLEPVVMGLGAWGARWQFGEPRDDELDAELLMWWVHDRLDLSTLPDRRVVLEFDFTDQRRRFWIVRDSGGPSVCSTDPGFEVDVVVRTDLPTMYRVWLGRQELRDAVRAGQVELSGQDAFVRRMPDVLQLSPVAPFVAAAVADA